MLDTNKLNEIGMNTDTINMMKKMNMNNDDIFNELKIILTLYPENLITCLINDINEPLFQSILLRLRLQEKLKLDNNKLRDSFNENLYPLINYLLCEENVLEENVVEEENVLEKNVLEEETLSDVIEEETLSDVIEEETLSDEEDSLDKDKDLMQGGNYCKIFEYIDECIIEDNNNFLKLDDVYDDFVNDWLESKEYNNIDITTFTKFFSEKYGKLKSKDKVKGWKNININSED